MILNNKITDKIPRKTLKGIIAWCLYDWANSAFPIIVTTFIFATYFTKKVAQNHILGTTQWGDTMAIAGVCVALLSPILGAITDHSGRRKPWLAAFCLLCIISVSLLWFAYPTHASVFYMLIVVAISAISYELSNVVYNSMLKFLVNANYVGRLSGWGWGCGYFGGLFSLVICLFLFIKGYWHGLDTHTAEQIRICGPLVGVWFLVFAWPLFKFTPDQPSTGVPLKQSIKLGLTKLYKTIRNLKNYKEIMKFLLARIVYIDGLTTVFTFGGIYAAGTFHMSLSQVILFGIGMNVAAGIGSVAMAWLDDWVGSKFIIMVSLVMLIISASAILLVTSTLLFWIFGMCLSLFVGPVQAASRSLLIHLSPPKMLGEMFGLYAFSGKATAFLGPFLLAQLTYIFKSQRIGMSVVVVLFVIGLGILTQVKSPQ